MLGEVELSDAFHGIEGDGPFAGSFHAGEYVGEGVVLRGESFPNGAVVEGAQVAQVEGGGIGVQALSFQVVFVAVDEVGVEVGGREVFAAEVSGEAVFHGVVGFGGARPVEFVAEGYLLADEGEETFAALALQVEVSHLRGGVVLVRLFESVYDALQLGVVIAEGLSDVLQVGFALSGGGFGDDAPGLSVPFAGMDVVTGGDLSNAAVVDDSEG